MLHRILGLNPLPHPPLQPVYSIEFPIPFAHNYVRAFFAPAPLILDPWRNYQSPVWEERQYIIENGISPTPGTFNLHDVWNNLFGLN
jgi:hypothetical protein